MPRSAQRFCDGEHASQLASRITLQWITLPYTLKLLVELSTDELLFQRGSSSKMDSAEVRNWARLGPGSDLDARRARFTTDDFALVSVNLYGSVSCSVRTLRGFCISCINPVIAASSSSGTELGFSCACGAIRSAFRTSRGSVESLLSKLYRWASFLGRRANLVRHRGQHSRYRQLRCSDGACTAVLDSRRTIASRVIHR
jgi:hypothetical protein